MCSGMGPFQKRTGNVGQESSLVPAGARVQSKFNYTRQALTGDVRLDIVGKWPINHRDSKEPLVTIELFAALLQGVLI